MEIDARVTKAVARLDQITLPTARARLAEMGEDASGSYNFYKVRIEQGSLFARYDLELATQLLATPGLPPAFHEVGGGFASFSFLMVALGFNVICLEQDHRRFNGAEALWQAIVDAEPGYAGALRLVRDRFPSLEAEPDGAWVVTTNLVATATETQRLAIIAAMARYPTAIIDLDRFLEYAKTEDKRVALLAEFREAGFHTEPFLDLGANACFWRLSPR